MDAVQKAGSGHPGMPMGAAAMAYVLWTRHLKHNPADPQWPDRDRFVLSAGHGSMLLYSLLFLTGYEVTLDDLKQFRQWGSITPGHPENTHTAGVEMATGPLGQGISTAVGMAIAEQYLAARYNTNEATIVDHHTYVMASDGDLMEGISNEAASLAGHLGLGKLIVLYDDNHVTIDGSTSLSFTEDVCARYEALGWRTWHCDGMDVDAVDGCLVEAKADLDRPSLIACRTTIGYGSPNKAGKSSSHGAPLGADEVKLAKEALGIPEGPFWVDDEALAHFRRALQSGAEHQAVWEEVLNAYTSVQPSKASEFKQWMSGDLGKEWLDALPSFNDPAATRESSAVIINAVAAALPNFLSGCADLAESVRTHIKDGGDFEKGAYTGRNLNFGIREHAMAASINGITLHGGVRAFGGSFLIFSDYCRPSIRLAALMKCPSIFVFSHDSIGLGEDGPTHQPIEHLASLRAMPNLNVFRPADGNETSVAWKVALESRQNPTLLVLCRQKLPSLTPGMVTKHPAERGAYVLREASGGVPRVILVATGSEVSLAVASMERLESEGVPTRVVSMPSWFLFERQSAEYRKSVLGGAPVVSIEAGSTMGWSRYAQAHVGLDHFGASAPADVLFREFGFTVENVIETVKTVL